MPVYLPGLAFGGLGYGGASYGYSPYGSGLHPRLPVSVTGGYGGAPYGYASYGSVDITPPRVTGVTSLDGYRVEVFFNEDMDGNAALTDPTNYVFAETISGASTFGAALTAASVVAGTPSGLGFSSVIVTHTGSTLGGQYTVTVSGPTDIAGNPVGPPPTNSAVFYALGDAALVQVSLGLDDGRSVLLDFSSQTVVGQAQDLLSEASFSPGVDSTASYGITTTYPVTPTLGAATQTPGLPSQVTLDVHPMTSAVYDLTVGPSKAFEYSGTLLPDDDPALTGAEIGTGTSAASSSGLRLAKEAGVQYGWSFGDTSGRMIPGTTYRAGIAFQFSSASTTPAVLNSALGTFSISDGAIQVDLTLADVAGVKVINIVSGAYSSTVIASWDTAGTNTLDLVRNQKGDFYTVVFNGAPLNTFPVASATGAAVYGPGVAFVLSVSHKVTLFSLLDVTLSASLTLFTSAWNFIHGLPASFTGSTVLTNDKIITRYGPLVRGWGDATPATKQDVTVSLDGGAIDIGGVNPYVGEIYPLLPIPLAAAGTFTVTVDYIWFVNPAMELAGLNTRGLTLSTWDRAVGHDAESIAPLPEGSIGVTKTNRFPMGVALGPYARQSPKRVGHKYIGWQKDYSALTNAPTTLLLNQDPHAVSVGGLSADALAGAGIFDGQTTPPEAATPWVLDGVDTGSVVDGHYSLTDASSGPYGVGTAAFYKRDVDLSLVAHLTEAARFKVSSGYQPDGVFTGVGLGVHNGSHLVFVGALTVDGVSHVGVLKDATIPHLAQGWTIGPSASASGVTQFVISVAYADLPKGITSGHRLRIPDGVQAGVYTIADCGLDLATDGSVLITLTTELPQPVGDFGAAVFTLLFETLWTDEFISIRVSSVFPQSGTQVYLGGQVSGLVADLTEITPFPAQTSLLLPATEQGVVFWGSLSRRATSTSVWDLSQYTLTPQQVVQTVQGITALTEMNVIPQEDPNDPWYLVGGFGTGTIDSTGDQLLLKATSGESPIETQFFYERVEPFINPKVRVDSEATFKLDSAILGVGSAALRIQDTAREATVQTVWIQTDAAGAHRLLNDRPSASLSGLRSPPDAGWAPTASPVPPLSSVFVRGQTLELTKTSLDGGTWRKTAPHEATASDIGTIIDARLSVQSYTVGTVGIGIGFGAAVPVPGGTLERQISVSLTETGGVAAVELRDRNQVVVLTLPFAWNDTAFHDYRVLCDPTADVVVVVVDDVVVGSTTFSGFSSAVSSTAPPSMEAFVGYFGSGSCAATLDSLSVTPLRTTALSGDPALVRTFGVRLRGGDTKDIDSYRLPRTDGTGVANSHATATFKEMDWTSLCRVRMFLDPTWGVSVYRPDLPLPPTATGDFATETTDPSAAWINVEYRDLPTRDTQRGSVSFGSLYAAAISQQRWDSVRYRIRGGPEGFGIAPQGMVLNRAFTLTSGEYNLDVTPETATITSRTPYLVYVPDSDIFADRVFVVQVDGVVVPPANYTFDRPTQNLQFTSSAPLPSDQYPVTVTFAVGKPATKTYLCGQPIDETVTVLNEGTPPIPSGLDQPADREIESGGIINDPKDVLDEAEALVLNDPYRVVTFTDTTDSIYADLQFCTTEDGDSVHITPICDGPGPGLGLAHIEIDGHLVTNGFSVPEGPGGPWTGSPAISGSATHFNPATVFMASGGNILGGNLGPGTAILYPNQRGPNGLPPEGGMGINQDFALRLEDVTPRTEDLSIDTLVGDNVPPTYAEPVPSNPDAAPTGNGHGAAAYEMVDYATVTVSRLGPWGGLTALETRSLLAGGAQLNGSEFILEGGTQIPGPVVTTGYIRAAN